MNFFKTATYFLLFFLFVTPVFSADVSFVSNQASFDKNQEFLVSVFLNTEGEPLNAFEGELVFPLELLEEKEIRDGNSLVNFWVERPSLKQPGSIVFSGITPGGFVGTKGFLFSVVFRSKKSGEGSVQSNSLRLLRNNGTGTEAMTKAGVFSFFISEKTAPEGTGIEPIKDGESPEYFTPIISTDPNTFDGKFFLSFATQDKGSGIDYYEVREEGSPSFLTAKSPYLLKNQRLDAKIFVRAVDKAGNARIAELPAQHWSKTKQFAFVSIVLLLVILFVFRKKIWKKNILP